MTGAGMGRALAGSLAAVLLAGAASAANITYAVNRTVGAGSVVGTITTDGTLGVLSASDIVSFNLELNGVGASYNLVSPANVYVSGVDLTATSHDLYFDFSGIDGGRFLLQHGPEDGHTYYCAAASSADCIAGESVVPVFYSDASSQIVPRSGEQVIGVVVPEPAAWATMLLGFSLLGAVLRRRSALV